MNPTISLGGMMQMRKKLDLERLRIPKVTLTPKPMGLITL